MFAIGVVFLGFGAWGLARGIATGARAVGRLVWLGVAMAFLGVAAFGVGFVAAGLGFFGADMNATGTTSVLLVGVAFVLGFGGLALTTVARVVADASPPATPVAIPSRAPRAGSWKRTGDMTAARSTPCATLLPDGKVLVAGGLGRNSQSLATAELYDPRTGQWGATGSMAVARHGHTATLLPEGKVLAAGGSLAVRTGASTEASAELYDSDTGWWRTSARMAAARERHTATLLPDGKVLVVGGGSFPTWHLASTEAYDPGTDEWGASESMAVARAGHTATMLNDGTVLVTGGTDGGGWLTSAELYDPGAGRWSATGSMAAAHPAATATLLGSGHVLVVGSAYFDVPMGAPSVGSAELYDPGSKQWFPTGSMVGPLVFHRATVLPDGRVLVTGSGPDVGGEWRALAELYDPGTREWSPIAGMAAVREFFTSIALADGRVLVLGGGGGFAGKRLASAELYA